MKTQHTPGRLYIRTNRHPNTDGTPWGWVDLYESGSMRQASPEGIQVTWSRGQTSEANARRLVACWNALEDLPQASLDGGWTRAGLEAHALKMEQQARQMQAQRDELLKALELWLDIHDKPAGFVGKYGKSLTDAIAAQEVKVNAAASASRAAIAKVEGGAT